MAFINIPPYSQLGAIFQALGKFDLALEFFNKYNELCKELYVRNPQSVQLLEGLGISYYKLAMINKALGDHKNGNENFLQWKNIISHLANNLPQVPKYQQWNSIQY